MMRVPHPYHLVPHPLLHLVLATVTTTGYPQNKNIPTSKTFHVRALHQLLNNLSWPLSQFTCQKIHRGSLTHQSFRGRIPEGGRRNSPVPIGCRLREIRVYRVLVSVTVFPSYSRYRVLQSARSNQVGDNDNSKFMEAQNQSQNLFKVG